VLSRRKVSVPLVAAVTLAGMLAVAAVIAMVFASIALAQTPGGSASASASASPTAAAGSNAAVSISAAASVSPSATATASPTALAETGGSSVVPAVTWGATLALVVCGLAALRLVLRRGAS
jgi:hypothetical protein